MLLKKSDCFVFSTASYCDPSTTLPTSLKIRTPDENDVADSIAIMNFRNWDCKTCLHFWLLELRAASDHFLSTKMSFFDCILMHNMTNEYPCFGKKFIFDHITKDLGIVLVEVLSLIVEDGQACQVQTHKNSRIG